MKQRVFILCLVVGMLLGTMKSVAKAEEEEKLQFNKQLELHMDGNVTDTSLAENQISVVGTEQYVDGVSGQAFAFDGQTYIDLGTSESLQPENLTVSFWIRTEEPLEGEHMLFWFKTNGDYAGEGWYLSCLSTGVPLKLSVGAASNCLPTEAFVSTQRGEFFKQNTWYHIVVTYNEETKEACFYKDGDCIQTKYVNDQRLSIQGTTDHKYIGFNSPAYDGSYCTLELDEVTIYDQVLSKEQVQSIYQKTYKEYTRSQMKEKICYLGLLLLGGMGLIIMLVFVGRVFYKRLIKKVSEEMLEKVNAAKQIEPMVEKKESKNLQQQVKEYIEERYCEKTINLNLMGEYFGVTPSYLSKLYREVYKESPIEYLTSIRIQKAKELLMTTDNTIEQIADQVGYFSSSVFIRSFKKIENMTPGFYRKSRKEREEKLFPKESS